MIACAHGVLTNLIHCPATPRMISAEETQRAELQRGDDDSLPDIAVLESLYRQTVADLSSHQTQQQLNHDARYCIWGGQTDDGRKRAKLNGTPPFPWDGASDLRVPLIDEIINHGVSMDVLALQKANLRAVGVESGDLAKAAVVSNFLRWLVMSQMSELFDEAEVLANYRRENGIGVLGIYWERKVQKTQIRLSLAEVEQGMPDIAEAIRQDAFHDELVKLVVQMLGVSAKRARRMLRELRDAGETTVPHTSATVNRPVVKAYRVGEDIFVPNNTGNNLQAARHVFVRCLMSPEELREKVISEGWDEDAVEDVIETGLGLGEMSGADSQSLAMESNRVGLGSGMNDGLVEVVRAYRRLSDEDGVPGIYCTIFFPWGSADHSASSDGKAAAKHELLGYAHGLYPFVAFKRENISRLLLDTRGIPEVGKCWQDAVKVEMDSRIDAASLATVPPRRGPVGREPGSFSPGGYIGERRPGEYGFMDIPPSPAASVEVQQRIEVMTRRYFGRSVPDDAVQDWQVKQQKETQGWLRSWQGVFAQIWELYQQYGPDEEWFRVIGANTPKAQQFSKKSFSGKYDFYLSYDVLNTDPESWATKIETMGKLGQQYDKTGVMNWGEFLAATFEMIDPVLAERVMIPQEVASEKEVKATHDDLAKMWAGIDLDPPMVGVNADLRMKVMQNWLQGAPDNPARDVQTRVGQDESLRNRLERYQKQLQHQIDQRQNAQIGIQGATPAGATG